MNQEEGRGQLSRILNARILVVDDKEANVRLIEGMLRVAGHPEVSTKRRSGKVHSPLGRLTR